MSIKQLFPGFIKQFGKRAPPLQKVYLRIRAEKHSLTEWSVLLMEAP